tara:strand:- start:3654 stop:4283 length:630 start_codon:yes stop_codon:yes gene_type:complete
MKENYKILPNGVIAQNKYFSTPQVYNQKYIDTRYNSYGEKGMQMAYLRLGYLLGNLKSTPNSILDIGYGNGDFLKVCTDIIPECYGSDISGYPVPSKVQFIEDIYSKHFDVVSFFDVLEHFEDINFVKDLKCTYIIISVPFCHFFSEEWFLNWKHRRPDEHLFHFNDKSLNNFFSEMGFDVVVQSHIEDIIRTPTDNTPNILTGIYKKR